MRQLSGMDASFLRLDGSSSGATQMGSFAIDGPSTAPARAVAYDQIVGNVQRRLHLARVFRQRLVHVPMEADHPHWIEDALIDDPSGIRCPLNDEEGAHASA